jgi:tetratricopeptide (TPR) repeat protein
MGNNGDVGQGGMSLTAFRFAVPSIAVWVVTLAVAPMAAPGLYGQAEARAEQVSKSAERVGSIVEAAENAYLEGRFQDALRLYSRALKLNPEESSVHLGRGMTYEMLGRSSQAAKDYRKALQYDPENYRAMENLGGILERKGKRLSDAVELYERALRLDPRPAWQENLRAWIRMLHTRVNPRGPSAVALWNRANEHAARGNLDEAERTYSEAIAVNPGLYHAYFSRGLVRLKRGDFDQALEDFNAAVRIAPRWAPALIELGLVHEKLGREQHALEYFRRAAKVDPRDSAAHYHVGRLLEEMGDVRGALDSYEEAIRLKPKAPLRSELQRRIKAMRIALKSRRKEDPTTLKMMKRLW